MFFEMEQFQNKKIADSDLFSVLKILSLLNCKGLMKFEEIAPLLISVFLSVFFTFNCSVKTAWGTALFLGIGKS